MRAHTHTHTSHKHTLVHLGLSRVRPALTAAGQHMHSLGDLEWQFLSSAGCKFNRGNMLLRLKAQDWKSSDLCSVPAVGFLM